MRFGLALALLLGVIVMLYVAPTIRDFAHYLRNPELAAARVSKTVHAEDLAND